MNIVVMHIDSTRLMFHLVKAAMRATTITIQSVTLYSILELFIRQSTISYSYPRQFFNRNVMTIRNLHFPRCFCTRRNVEIKRGVVVAPGENPG